MKDTISRYGKWVLVTGASSGIGEAFAREFARRGHNLVLIARRRERLLALSNEFKSKFKIEVQVIKTDLSKKDFLNNILEQTGDIEISILINNAGFGLNGEAISLDDEEQEKMVLVNCFAPVVLTNHFMKPMKEKGKGAVIFLGSMVGFQPVPYMSLYAATKAFNLLYGEGLWFEMKKYGVDVLSINPGSTKTEFQRIANIETGPTVRTAEDVVKTTLDALGKKPSKIDGLLNKIAVFLNRILPRKTATIIWGIAINKMRNIKE